MNTAISDRLKLDHIGLRVSNIERSTRFYCEALGFESLSDVITIGQEFAKLSAVDGDGDVKINLRFIRRDGLVIELLHREIPAITKKPASDQFGLWHLSFDVDDIDTHLPAIRRLGGEVLEQTRTKFALAAGETMEIVYCTDPDGQYVELTILPPSMKANYTPVRMAGS